MDNKEDLLEALNCVGLMSGPILLEVRVKKGNRKDLGRPTVTPVRNKELFMNFLK